MNVKRSQLVKMFKAIEYPTAAKWDNDKLLEKLKELPSKLEEIEMPSGPSGELLESLLEAIEEEEDIKIIGKPVGAAAKATKKKVAKKKVTTKKTKKAAPATRTAKKKTKKTAARVAKKTVKKSKKTKKTAKKKTSEPAGRDKFGSRIGSTLAEVNACLSRKPKSMSEICEAVSSTNTFYEHMNKLVEAGLVEKVEGKGFRIAKQ